MNGCFWKMVHYFQHKFYNLPQKKAAERRSFFLIKIFLISTAVRKLRNSASVNTGWGLK